MASFGEIVTQVRADYSQYEKDLKKALQLAEDFHTKAQRVATTSLQARQRAAASGTGGQSLVDLGTAKNTEAFERNLRRQRDVAESEFRRLGAAQERAEKENAARLAAVEKEKTRQIREAEKAAEKAVRDRLRIVSQLERQQLAARKEVLRSQIADEKAAEKAAEEALAQKVAANRAANAKIQSLAAEEQKTFAAETKARADAEKEFASFVSSSLREGGQGALARARNADKERTEELKKSGAAARDLNKHLEVMKKNFKELIDNVKNFAKYVGAGFVVGGAVGLVGEAIKLNRELQLQRLGLAANLQLTTKIVDAHGRYVGQQKEVNLNIAAAGKLLQQIRKEAERTTLTEQELRPVTVRTLGLAMQRGASQEQAVTLIAQLANVAKIAGVQGEQQLSANVRGVLTGKAVGRLALGQFLGLDQKQIQEARESGTLIELLTKRLQVMAPIIQQANASFDHMFSTLISKAKDFIQISTEKVFEKLTGHILDLNKAFSDEKIQEYAERFSKGITNAYDSLERFVKSDGFKLFLDGMKWLASHAIGLLELFAGFKVLKFSNDVVKLFQLLRGGTPAGTLPGIGRGLGTAGRVLSAGSGGSLLGAGGGLARGLGVAGLGGVLGTGALVFGTGVGLGLAATEGAEALGTQAGTQATPDLVRDRSLIQERLQAAVLERKRRERLLASAQVTYERNVGGGGEDAARKALQVQDYMLKLAEKGEGKIREQIKLTEDIKDKLKKDGLRRVQRFKDDEEQKEAEEAEKQRLDVAKQIADLTNDKIQARRVEHELTKASAMKDVDDEGLRNKLIAESYKAMVRDIHRLREDARIAEKEARAKDSKDEIALIRVTAEKEFIERKRGIEDSVKDAHQAAIKIGQLRVQVFGDANRQIAEKEKEFYAKATDYARQYHDLLRHQGEERASLNKELHDLETRHIKEMANLLRQRIGAQEELNRAEKREPINEENVFIRRDRAALRERARAMLGTVNPLSGTSELGEIRRGFELPGSPRFENEADQERAIQAAIERRIDQMVASPGFAAANRDLENRELLNKGKEERQQLSEDLADIGKPAQTARERLTDINDQLKDNNQSYQEATQAIREKFTKAIEDLTSSFVKLGAEMTKFLDTVRASHVNLTPSQREALAAGARITPSNARQNVGQAIGGGTEVGNRFPAITFNITNANPETVTRMVTAEIEKLMRRTAPIMR